MLEERLLKGYTFYFSYDRKDNVRGGYLKKIDRGLCPLELDGDEEILIQQFSNVFNSLQQGKTLQMYRGDISHMFIAMLGDIIREGPYGENECFSDIVVGFHNSPVLAIGEVEKILENSKEKVVVYKKAYRLYGNDKYMIY